MANLAELSDGLIISICGPDYGLEAVDLANLEETALRFRARTVQLRAGGDASVTEAAAEAQLIRHPGSWRVTARDSESLKQILFIVEHRLPVLPTLAAGQIHALMTGGSNKVVAFGATAKWLIEAEEQFVPRTKAMLPSEKIVSVAAGHNHSACLTEDGHLWTWGLTRRDSLGDGVRTQTDHFVGHGHPAFVPRRLRLDLEFQRVAFVATGVRHTAFVTSTGHVFTCGEGVNGCLGHGNFERQPIPKLVSCIGSDRAVAVGCGDCNTVVLTLSGRLLTAGVYYPQGRMGKTPLFVQLHPREPREPDWEFDAVPMRQVSCGQAHCAAIGADGTLFTWGEGEDGALGHENHLEGCALPFQVDALRGKVVTKVSCGSSHTAAVTSTGELWTWGTGQLGRNNPRTITNDDRGDDIPRRVVVLKAQDYSQRQRLTDASSGAYVDGVTLPKSITREPHPRNGCPVVDVACGYGYTIVKLCNGEIQTFGNNACTHLKVRGYSPESYDPDSIRPAFLFYRPQVVDHMTVSGEIALWPRMQ